MFKKPVWDDLNFVTWCIILLEVAIRRWVHCRYGLSQQQYSGRVWCLNDAQFEQRSPKCAKKISTHHYTTTTSLNIETSQNGSMLSCSLRQILTLPSECRSRNRDSSDQARFSQSFIVKFLWACANCSLRFLFLADRSDTWCGLPLL